MVLEPISQRSPRERSPPPRPPPTSPPPSPPPLPPSLKGLDSCGLVEQLRYSTPPDNSEVSRQVTQAQLQAFGAQGVSSQASGLQPVTFGAQGLASQVQGLQSHVVGARSLGYQTQGLQPRCDGAHDLSGQVPSSLPQVTGAQCLAGQPPSLLFQVTGAQSIVGQPQGFLPQVTGANSLANQAPGLPSQASGTQDFAAQVPGLPPQVSGTQNLAAQVPGLPQQASGTQNLVAQVSGVPQQASGTQNFVAQVPGLPQQVSGTQNFVAQVPGLPQQASGTQNTAAQVPGLLSHVQGASAYSMPMGSFQPPTATSGNPMQGTASGVQGTPLSVESHVGRGRGEFEPGDRTFWDLPRLASVQEANAAVRASDWLYRSTLLLRDLSARSWQWFDRVYEVALGYYAVYQQSDPLQRGLLRPYLPQDLQDPTFARLESRAVQMFLQALPESVVNQATATRTLSTVGLLYQVLKQYQPGGLHERAELLKALTDLSTAQSPGDAVLSLQQWFRHISRARGMNIQLPDGSLLLAGFDNSAKHLLSQHAQVAFRLSLTRHSLRLDYQASIETVEEYAKVMLAEFEVLALSSERGGSVKRQRQRKIKDPNAASEGSRWYCRGQAWE